MTNVKTAVGMEMLAAEAQSKIAYFCLKLDQRAAHMATSMAQFAADKPALNLGELGMERRMLSRGSDNSAG